MFRTHFGIFRLMIIKISNRELIEELVGEPKEYPKYTSQIINLANRNSQGTRPPVVGQLSNLIQECPEKTYEGWKKWYLSRYPNSIDNAVQKIANMVANLRNAMEQIDEELVKKWVEDLVLEKTYVGLRFHEAILKKVSTMKNLNYRLADSDEESQGIDGFIGDIPISIKPVTYKTKDSLVEELKGKIIFYNKTKTGLQIDTGELMEG